MEEKGTGHASLGTEDVEEVDEFYLSETQDTVSLYDQLKPTGRYARPELEEIVAYLVSEDGVELRKARCVREGGGIENVRYWKGSRLAECFPDVLNEIKGSDDERLNLLGEAIVSRNYAVRYTIADKSKRIMAPVAGHSRWNPKGFFVWTPLALQHKFDGDESDLIGVLGGDLRRRRRRRNNPSRDSTNVRVDRISNQTSRGVNWLHIAILFMLFGPPIYMGLMWSYEMVAMSPLGTALGLAVTPREQLMQLYQQYAPEKATYTRIDRLLKKHSGREAALLVRVREKYEAIRRAKAREAEEWASTEG